MRRRVRINAPTSEDTLLERVCKALDETPFMVATKAGLSFKDDVEPLLGAYKDLAQFDEDPVWDVLYSYVGERLGLLMAARAELEKARNKTRHVRAARVAQHRAISRAKRRPNHALD